jgi:hypothetical protein
LAKAVAKSPAVGISAYKPPNSEPGYDAYIMDIIGMLGIPLIPVSTFPEDADVIFLSTQAAADPDLHSMVEKALERGATVVVSAGCALTGADVEPVRAEPTVTQIELKAPFEHYPGFPATIEDSLPEMLRGTEPVNDFLAKKAAGDGHLYLLNTWMFTQADYDAINEVLLTPRWHSLLDLSREAANQLRDIFTAPPGYSLDAPPRVTIHNLGDEGFVIQNFRFEPTEVVFTLDDSSQTFNDVWSGRMIRNGHPFTVPARGRVWLRGVQP